MGFNSAFKGLMWSYLHSLPLLQHIFFLSFLILSFHLLGLSIVRVREVFLRKCFCITDITLQNYLSTSC